MIFYIGTCYSKVEAAWKLCNWDLLRDIVGSCKDSPSLPWGVGVGKVILAAKDKQVETFHDTMKTLKKVCSALIKQQNDGVHHLHCCSISTIPLQYLASFKASF